jgi:cell division initiation protein
MFIAPAEVQHQELKRRLRGYSKDAVDRLLEELSASYEQVWRERDQLRKRVEELEKEIAPLREAASYLTDTLVTAQQAAEQLREQAAADAEALLEQAREKGKLSNSALKGQETRLKNEIERLRSVERELHESLRSFLRSGLELVEDRKPPKPTPVVDRESTEPTPVIDQRPSLHKTEA